MYLTYKEMMDQYKRLAITKNYLDKEMQNIQEAYEKHNFVVYIGCGSSYSLAKTMSSSTAIILGKKSMAVSAGDILLRPEVYKKVFQNSLIVAISRSGTTSEILMACEALKKNSCSYELLSYSCTTNQKLALQSDYAFELPWAFDKSICQTGTVSNLYFIGQYTLSVMAKDSERIKALIKIIELGNKFLVENEEESKNIAKMDWNFGVTLADAEIVGICEEASLAFKEICRLPSNYYNVLDVRHGPIVVINEKTLVFVAIKDINNKLERDLIKDLQSKHCKIVTISDVPLKIDGTLNFNLGEKTTYSVIGLLLLNMVQMVTYFKALEFDINPDKPTGLDAWINLDK